jgi:hypothetical protein
MRQSQSKSRVRPVGANDHSPLLDVLSGMIVLKGEVE